MLFHFQLRPMRDIAPWHDANGSNPHLHWFGLTDGWYWIEVGKTELFRYSEAALRQGAQQHQGEQWWIDRAGLPYADYQVVRLWEDVLFMLPDVFEPVPRWLARTLGPDGTWTEWEQQADVATQETLPQEEAADLFLQATDWLGPRCLDGAYLVGGPAIWIWSDGQDVHVWWDNREQFIEGVPAWQAVLGEYTMPGQAYLDEVHGFDARFLRRMRDRVAIAQTDWARPDVTLDPDLAEEHRVRERWSKQCFETSVPRQPTDWDAVAHAIERIEALPRFAAEAATRLR